jgi:hypothetical protein
LPEGELLVEVELESLRDCLETHTLVELVRPRAVLAGEQLDLAAASGSCNGDEVLRACLEIAPFAVEVRGDDPGVMFTR